MRAIFHAASAAIVLASMLLVACDQDYAASDENRETFMGDKHAAPAPSVAPSAAPPIAPPTPPNVAPLPMLAPISVSDAGGDAAPGKGAPAAASAHAAGPAPHGPAAHP